MTAQLLCFVAAGSMLPKIRPFSFRACLDHLCDTYVFSFWSAPASCKLALQLMCLRQSASKLAGRDDNAIRGQSAMTFMAKL